jgi:hypothetical protein
MVVPVPLAPLWPVAEEVAEDELDLPDLVFALGFFSGSTLVTVALAGMVAVADEDGVALALPDWVLEAVVPPVWLLRFDVLVLALAPTSGVAVWAVVVAVLVLAMPLPLVCGGCCVS